MQPVNSQLFVDTHKTLEKPQVVCLFVCLLAFLLTCKSACEMIYDAGERPSNRLSGRLGQVNELAGQLALPPARVIFLVTVVYLKHNNEGEKITWPLCLLKISTVIV